YQRVLQGLLQTWSVVVVMGLLLFGATLLLGMTSKSELTPEEDQGFVFYQLKAAPDATAQQMLSYSQQMFAIGRRLPEYEMLFQNLNEVVQAVLAKARDSGKFWFVDTDLKIDKPQSTVVVDRDLISTLGLTQRDVGSALGDALGGGYVNYFSIAGRSYKVIPQ